MGFTLETNISALTVFFQGILSFFSPCVLPLLPLYISYLAGGAKTVDENGIIHYPKKQVLINTLFFVLGISFTFFALGLGVTALGQFFSDSRFWFAKISGIIMILFGLYQLGIFGQLKGVSSEHRLPFKINKNNMNAVTALVLGFTFSFAWTPCIGPTLSSVLLMAGSSASLGKALLLIGVYTLGFVLPFLAVGLFTGTVLDFFKKHNKIVKYTVKIGALLLIIMGVITITGFMDGISGFFAGLGQSPTSSTSVSSDVSSSVSSDISSEASSSAGSSSELSSTESASSRENPPSIDFTLKDQAGNEHTLSDYKGKTVFLNFWATWCPPCKEEMPEIQKQYEKYGNNEGDLIILGVAAPNLGSEGDAEHIKKFLSDNKYTFPVVMDTDGTIFGSYGVRSFPTTFMLDTDNNVYGYVEGGLSLDMMEQIISQTMEYSSGDAE